MVNAKINTVNFHPFARTSCVTVGVPFEQGEVTSANTVFTVQGALDSGETRRAQWYPVGATYADGSYKYGKFSFITDLGANATKEITIANGSSYTSSPFTIKPAVNSGVFSNNLIGLRVLENTHWMDLTTGVVVEDAVNTTEDVRYRIRKFERHALYPEIWMEVIIDVHSNLNHCNFWFMFGHCYAQRDLGRTAGPYGYTSFPGPRMPNGVFSSPQNAPVLWIAGPRSALHYEENQTFHVDRVDSLAIYYLMDPIGHAANNQNRLYWSTILSYKGVMVFDDKASDTANAEYLGEVRAMCKNWYPDKYPMFYSIPDYPEGITAGTDAQNRIQNLLNEMESMFIPQDVTCPNPWGNNPYTQAPGDQGRRGYAFGAFRGWPMLRTAYPVCQASIQRGTRVSGYRPNHIREIDGTWFKYHNYQDPNESPQHSQCLIWDGTIHSISNNLAGLGTGMGGTWLPAAYYEQFWGPNNQHGTFHMVMMDALTTMDYLAFVFIRNIMEMYKGQLDPYSYSAFPAGLETPRAVGRTLEALVMFFELTGDEEIRTLIENRINITIWNMYNSRTYGGPFPEYARFLINNVPTNQVGGSQEFAHWRPWEETYCLTGLYAASIMLRKNGGSATAIDRCVTMYRAIAASVCLYGHYEFTNGALQNIVLDNWSGIVNDWRPGSVINDGVNTGVVFFVETPGANGSSNRNASISLAPFLRLYLRQCTGAFNTGSIVGTSNNTSSTGRIAFINTPGMGVVYQESGSGRGVGIGLPVPESLWGEMEPENIARQPWYTPFGQGKWFALFKDYNFWTLPASGLALEAALLGYYGAPWDTEIQTKALRLLNINAFGSQAGLAHWDEQFYAFLALNQVCLNFNTVGAGVSIRPTESTLYTRALDPTVTAIGATSVIITLTGPVTLYVQNPDLTVTAVTKTASNFIFRPDVIDLTVNGASYPPTIRTTRPGPVVNKTINASVLTLFTTAQNPTVLLIGNEQTRTDTYRIIRFQSASVLPNPPASKTTNNLPEGGGGVSPGVDAPEVFIPIDTSDVTQ